MQERKGGYNADVNKIRLSYTLLNLFKMGRIDQALTYYFKMGYFSSPAMEAGKKWDEYLNEYTIEHKAYPEDWGGDKLNDPKAQVKLEMSYSEHFDLVTVFDVLDGPILYENKTGLSKNSSDYTLDFQVPLYFIMANHHKLGVEKAIIKHYNQYLPADRMDQSIVYNTKQEIARGQNFIQTVGGEIYSYFQDNKMWDKKVTNEPLDNNENI